MKIVAGTEEGNRVKEVRLNGMVIFGLECPTCFIRALDTDEGWVEEYEIDIDEKEQNIGLKTTAWYPVNPNNPCSRVKRDLICKKTYGKVEVVLG